MNASKPQVRRIPGVDGWMLIDPTFGYWATTDTFEEMWAYIDHDYQRDLLKVLVLDDEMLRGASA